MMRHFRPSTRWRWSAAIWLLLLLPVALAQRPPQPPRPIGERQIQPSLPAAPQANAPGAPAQNKPKTCEEVRRKARFGIYFDKVEIEKLVQTVSDATCKTFILPENVRGRISIIGPENGRVEVSADEFYQAFLAALDANSLAVYPHGRYLKIVDKQRAKQFPIPTVLEPDESYTTNEQMVTKMFKIKYVELEQLRGVLQQLVTPSGDTIPFQPDTLIINDVGSNMHRLEKIIRQLDSRSSSDEIRVIQIQYATAQEIADKIQKLFESKAQRPGQRPGLVAPPPPPVGGTIPQGQPASQGESSQGAATLSNLIPDERTNKLIVIASPAAMERIEALIREIDIPISGEGRINVYYLENANAEDLAATLQSLAQGTANRPKQPAPPPPPGQPKGPVTAAELFQGEVKISADKATNALVIIASQSDYRSLVRVIEKLDIPRRQVFIEAVIMEVNLDRDSKLGVGLHGGVPLRTEGALGGASPLVFGTKLTGGALPPSFSLVNLASFGGFLAGLQGPIIPELERLGLPVPAFGLVLHALQESSDVNVLSTPHILTTDNEEAEITVGQNVPFQAGFAPTGLAGLGVPGTSGTTGINPALLGGLGSLFAPITRQNVELKLSVKPQINESDFIRMVITESTEEIAGEKGQLGPITAKRSAKTTVVAKDQETVVLGGIMQDRTVESVSKVPILGDLPILGHLFREQSKKKVKTNLLLFLTPHIIRDQSDFRRIFERKMKERQEFIEQFYGEVPGYEVAIDFSRKRGPIAKMNEALRKELQKIEHGGPGQPGERVIQPSGVSVPAQTGAAPAKDAAPKGEAAPTGQPQVQEPAQPDPERLEVQPPDEEAR